MCVAKKSNEEFKEHGQSMTTANLVPGGERTGVPDYLPIRTAVRQSFWHFFFFLKHSYHQKKKSTGAWVAQSVEPLTPDLSSGHDPGREIEPRVGLCAECGACLRFSLTLVPSPLGGGGGCLALSKIK